MVHEESFFGSLNRDFVLKRCKFDALLDGMVHALYQSIGLGMIQ